MFWKQRIYLDAAAGVSANPSSPHTEGRESRALLEEARESIARLIGVKADAVVFTSGATEANAIAILGAARALSSEGPVRVFYLPSAHASLTENAKALADEGLTVSPLPLIEGTVDIAAFSLALAAHPEDAVLVAMEAVCGETGTVWDTRAVRKALDARDSKRPSVLHVDASQTPRTEKLPRAHFGADTLALDASKVGDERGMGCLIAPRHIELTPLYSGGGQERGLRPGSEDPVAAKAFANDLSRVARGREVFEEKASRLRAELLARLTAALPDIVENRGKEYAPHILSLSLLGRDTDYLVALLDEAGFAISTKSACETDSAEGSRAVFALTGDARRAASTLRISWDERISARDMERFSDALIRAVHFIDTDARG